MYDNIWQTAVWVNDERVVVYGQTLKGLRKNVRQELLNREADLTDFANFDPSAPEPRKSLHRRWRYLLLDAKRLQDSDIVDTVQRQYDTLPDVDEKPGWYSLDYNKGARFYREQPTFVDSLAQAAQDYVDHAVIPEKGPDYSDPFADSNTVPLHRIKTIMRVESQERTNDAINRGWHLLQLDAKGTEDPMGRLKDRETIYVLGHTEERAV